MFRTLVCKQQKRVLENTRDEIIVKKQEGLTIYRNPEIEFNTIFGKLELNSPYLWIQGISSKSLIDAMKISHLYETAEEIWISKKDRTKWIKSRIEAISNGDVGTIMEELKEEYDRNPNKRLKRLIGYIQRFYDALNYNKFKDKIYPIGSGEIESAYKSIPQKKLKIPGASWHPNSIDPMLALRILRADDWWDDFFWKQRAERLMAA